EAHPTGVDRERAGLQAAHVEQVADERVEPFRLVVDRLQQRLARGRIPLHVVGQQAGGGGPDRRERRAQVVADGGQQRGAQLVRLRERGRARRLRLQTASLQGQRDLRGERR